MTARSLRLRLFLSGAAAIVCALALAAMGLNILFARHAERLAVADLEARALTVAALVDPRTGATDALRRGVPDPTYDLPLSGHYWQVELGADVFRARSLWDYTFPSAEGPPAEGFRTLVLAGPRGEALIAVERRLVAEIAGQPVPLRIVVATDRAEVDRALSGFAGDMVPFLALLGLLLAAASWVQVSVGLRPVADVARAVAALRAGRQARIGKDVPSEVLPLANEIDELLSARDAELERTGRRAGDLAHGLKTPLQALLGDAAALRARGEVGAADGIEAAVSAMRGSVERELARARMRRNADAATADPAVVIPRVVGVLRRTPAGGRLDWDVDLPAGLSARIDPADLTEAVGALVENAARHALGRVVIGGRRDGPVIVLSIRDDGSGVPEADLDRLAQRGVRLDEGGAGQGFGLAIVAEIAEAVGGELRLANVAQGFEARLSLRASGSAAAPPSSGAAGDA